MGLVACLLIIACIMRLWAYSHCYISNASNGLRWSLREEPDRRNDARTGPDLHRQSSIPAAQHALRSAPCPGSISIALGEVPRPLYCNRAIAYLQFNFNALQRDSHGHPTVTGIDNFTDVRLRKK